MRVDFAFLEFDLGDKEDKRVTKRIGVFKVNENDERYQQEFKQLLNQQPGPEIHGEIKTYIMKLLRHYSVWQSSQKQTSESDRVVEYIEAILSLFGEDDKENDVKMSLAYLVQTHYTWCYIQVYTESQNWEIVFEMSSETKKVQRIQIYENDFAATQSYFRIIFDSWIHQFLQKSSGLLQKPKSGNISDLLVKDDDEVNGDLHDEGGGVPGPAHDDLQDDDLPLVFESEAPVYISKVYEKLEKYQFWQSWAQWVFMFQDHKKVKEGYKEFFMQYFMTLVARELFDVSGKVSYVTRHKDTHKTKDLGRLTKVHTGDHIVAHHDLGKILVLYRNLPHGESAEDYNKLISETGEHRDTMFLYIGEGADLAYCEKLESLEKFTTKFYGHTTTGHSGSRPAAATEKGNDGTKNLMVGGSDEEDENGKSRKDRIKEIEKEYKKVEAGRLLQDNWRVHLAKKRAERMKPEKAKRELEKERKREREKWEKEREKMEEERGRNVHVDADFPYWDDPYAYSGDV